MRNFCLGLVAMMVFGCSYGYETTTAAVLNRSYSYRPHNRPIEVFFGDQQPVRNYEQIGLIEVQGGEYEGMESVMAEVKYRAQKIGADAVMAIKKGFTTREEEITIWDLFDDEEPEKYTAHVITAVAIKYIETGEKKP